MVGKASFNNVKANVTNMTEKVLPGVGSKKENEVVEKKEISLDGNKALDKIVNQKSELDTTIAAAMEKDSKKPVDSELKSDPQS